MEQAKSFADTHAAEAFQIASEVPEMEIFVDRGCTGLRVEARVLGLRFNEIADESKLLLIQVRAMRAAIEAYKQADTELYPLSEE